MGKHDDRCEADDTRSPLLSRDSSPTDSTYLMSIRIAESFSPPTSPTPTSSTTAKDHFAPPSSPRKPSLLTRLKQIENVRGWMVCFAAYVINVPFFGIIMSFGELLPSFLELYNTDQTAAISWVGSLAFGLAYVCSPISSRLYWHFGCRPCAITGVALGSFALFVSSFVHDMWWMMITYSIMFGFATNLTYNTPLVLTGEWFPDRHHVLATCFVTAGIPFGSLTMNPVVESLVDSIGLRNAFRVMAVLPIVIGLPCCAIFKQPDLNACANKDDDDVNDLIMEDCDDETVLVHRNDDDVVREIDDAGSESSWLADMIRREKNPSRKVCTCLDGDLWLDPIFYIYMFGLLAKGVGYVFPFIHLVNYMTWLGIESAKASFVMTAKGASDMAGRFIVGMLGDHLPFPLIHVYVIACGIMGVVTYVAVFAHHASLMFFYAICIGFCNGTFNALLFPINTSLFRKDLRQQTWAYCQVPPGVAIIVGPMIAGAIYDATQSYYSDFYVNTFVFVLAMLVFTLIPIIHLKRKIEKKRLEAGAPSALGGASNIIEMTKIFMRGDVGEANERTSNNNYGATTGPRAVDSR
ncbi:monocarboxylate transporter 8-like [Lytechinus pictus]|uniref:monocarboxylate transporter 8-like n=1 Tax=Lytechinus pictus TaxID=7653 RepID=UPI00240E708B|nr:monocarboxylate transporter 8-like [Lytechinus pictus]